MRYRLYKVKLIKAIDVLTKVGNVHRFVVIVHYYKDMYIKRTHTLSTLTNKCLMKIKFKWTDVENSEFIAMKKIVQLDVLLSCPNFSERFIIHTDTSKPQLGGVMIQNGNPVAFYSHKLIPALIKYRNT